MPSIADSTIAPLRASLSRRAASACTRSVISVCKVSLTLAKAAVRSCTRWSKTSFACRKASSACILPASSRCRRRLAVTTSPRAARLPSTMIQVVRRALAAVCTSRFCNKALSSSTISPRIRRRASVRCLPCPITTAHCAASRPSVCRTATVTAAAVVNSANRGARASSRLCW